MIEWQGVDYLILSNSLMYRLLRRQFGETFGGILREGGSNIALICFEIPNSSSRTGNPL